MHKSVKDYINFDIGKDSKEKILSYFSRNTSAECMLCHSALDYISGEEIKSSIYEVKSEPQSLAVYEKDGFTWTNEIIYHFEKYNLKLNDDFIQHVLNNS